MIEEIQPRAFAWLMKSEPSEVSVDDVLKMEDQTVGWFGVRNYQARNFMMKEMRVEDPVFFYHSSCKEPGIVGIAEVVSDAYPDPTQFDESSEYFDPKATEVKPRWYQVDVKVKEKIPLISLQEIRNTPGCETMRILQKGNRLSITPVTRTEYEALLSLIKKTKGS